MEQRTVPILSPCTEKKSIAWGMSFLNSFCYPGMWTKNNYQGRACATDVRTQVTGAYGLYPVEDEVGADIHG